MDKWAIGGEGLGLGCKLDYDGYIILDMASEEGYNHKAAEEKWLRVWAERGLFQGMARKEMGGKKKRYLLFAFAYPSGVGLHVGHVESNTALDILARFYRMQGEQVFFPVGWDAFGLPAENYAIKTGVPPAVTTKEAIKAFRKQVKRLGISYDWDTEVATCHPGYYKWTQWLFLQLYKKGLAYKKPGMVNWCPSCQTVLANEQVIQRTQNSELKTQNHNQKLKTEVVTETVGVCERCETAVVQKEMEQWYFKITDYTEELIAGLGKVDWPKATKEQQLHWIGKKEGVSIRFKINDPPAGRAGLRFKNYGAGEIECFTTRVDTIFGVTYVAVSPELVKAWMEAGWPAGDEVKAYVERAFHKTEEERKIGEREKTGVETGLKAVNPVNGQEIPVWVADYVLAEYGTGAVMGVPAHDLRDLAFAKKFGLPVVTVIDVGEGKTDYGKLVNSGGYDGLTSQEAMERLVNDFAGVMVRKTNYKLRDWLISRQRYWGAPIPIVYDPEGKPHPVKEEHLPWLLPTDVEFKPTGESPLTYSKEFGERVEKWYGPGWRPEYDTMDTFVDSSWYYLRYLSARAEQVPFEREQVDRWLPVDFYMIGPEHIVLHLLYSRFLTKFLRDEGYLGFGEPFMKMRHQGMILGPDHRKMSKSKGNVITPDEIIEAYGADTLRLYEMFMGPIEVDKPWDPRAVNGVYRFLQRLWRLVMGETGRESVKMKQVLAETVVKLAADIPELKFNTAIAQLMILVNEWEVAKKEGEGLGVESKRQLVKAVAPLIPFMAEEMWQILRLSGGTNATRIAQAFGSETQARRDDSSDWESLSLLSSTGQESVHEQQWPVIDANILVGKPLMVVVQVNGKVRGNIKLQVTSDLPRRQAGKLQEEEVVKMAKDDGKIGRWLEGKEIKRVVWIEPTPKRQGILNLVV